MRIVYIGGSGIISTACTLLTIPRGHQRYLLNRGTRPIVADGAKVLFADIHHEAATTRVPGDLTFDAVVARCPKRGERGVPDAGEVRRRTSPGATGRGGLQVALWGTVSLPTLRSNTPLPLQWRAN